MRGANAPLAKPFYTQSDSQFIQPSLSFVWRVLLPWCRHCFKVGAALSVQRLQTGEMFRVHSCPPSFCPTPPPTTPSYSERGEAPEKKLSVTSIVDPLKNDNHVDFLQCSEILCTRSRNRILWLFWAFSFCSVGFHLYFFNTQTLKVFLDNVQCIEPRKSEEQLPHCLNGIFCSPPAPAPLNCKMYICTNCKMYLCELQK